MARISAITKPPADDRYISVNEFCEKYSISRASAERLMHRPGFPRIKVGKLVRIAEAAAHDFVLRQNEG
jgi:predicted DNA-binding transcriptional regulator AlpA